MDIFPAYLEEKGDSGKWNWKALKPFWGSYRPEEISREACKRYIKKRHDQGVKNGTIHRELTMLRAAVRWNDPQTKAVFEMPKRPPPKDFRLTKAECKKLIKGAVKPHTRLFIILALTTAARASAILDLTWDRVDFKRGEIKLAKGGEHRLKGRATVPMNATSRKALEDAERASLSDYVIELGAKRLANVRKSVTEAGLRAGIKGVSPHVLRHTAACLMAEDGVSIPEIAQFLGHSSPDITFRVYARYSPSHLKKAASALEFGEV